VIGGIEAVSFAELGWLESPRAQETRLAAIFQRRSLTKRKQFSNTENQ